MFRGVAGRTGIALHRAMKKTLKINLEVLKALTKSETHSVVGGTDKSPTQANPSVMDGGGRNTGSGAASNPLG